MADGATLLATFGSSAASEGRLTFQILKKTKSRGITTTTMTDEDVVASDFSSSHSPTPLQASSPPTFPMSDCSVARRDGGVEGQTGNKKRSFRIDDILFSVSNSVEKKLGLKLETPSFLDHPSTTPTSFPDHPSPPPTFADIPTSPIKSPASIVSSVTSQDEFPTMTSKRLMSPIDRGMFDVTSRDKNVCRTPPNSRQEDFTKELKRPAFRLEDASDRLSRRMSANIDCDKKTLTPSLRSKSPYSTSQFSASDQDEGKCILKKLSYQLL